MRILIIGGTRFMGYHLTRRLLDEGHEVIVFNRGISGDDFGARVGRIKGDRTDFESFRCRLKDMTFDVVIDMMAFRAEDSLAAVRTFEGRIGQFVHISTGAVYGVTRNFPCPLREEDFNRELLPEPEGGDEEWRYGFHKRKCEEVLDEAHRRSQFPVMILRLPVVVGERDYTLRAFSYFIRITDGKPMILPDAGLNAFTHIYQGDVVKTISSNLLNRASFGQVFNLAQEEILTVRSFVLQAARIMNKDIDLVDIPTDVLEMTELGTDFSPYSRRRPFIMAVEKAKKVLGYSSTPFETWLRETITWFEEIYRGGPPDNYDSRERELAVISRYREAVEDIR